MKKFLTALMVMLMGVSVINTNTYAYDMVTNNYDDGTGKYYVDADASKTSDNIVTLYVLFPADVPLSGNLHYEFDCTTLSNFKDYDGWGDSVTMEYTVRLESGIRVKDKEGNHQKIGDGVLLAYTFNLENGTYIFSGNTRSINFETLSPDLRCPLDIPFDLDAMVRGDESTVVNFPVTLTGGYTNLYAVYIPTDSYQDKFATTNDNLFVDYIKNMDLENKNNGSIINNQDILDKDELKDKVDKLQSEDEKHLTDEKVDNILNESNQSVDNTPSDNTNVTVTTPDKTTTSEDTSGPNKILLFGIGGVVLLGVIWFVIKK